MKWLRNLWKASRRPVSARQRFRPTLENLEDRLAPAILTVTSNADPAAPNGQTILRDAILSIDAGADQGSFVGGAHTSGAYGATNTIVFQLPVGQTIIQVNPGTTPSASAPTGLPSITANNTIINGWSGTTGIASATGTAPLVEIDGSKMTAPSGTAQGYLGLDIEASGCTIEGLAIGGFKKNANAILGQNNGTGILFASNPNIANPPAPNDNLVEGCYLGLGLGGGQLANDQAGVSILGGQGNSIGGATTFMTTINGVTFQAGNVISGNSETGVKLGGYHNNPQTITGDSTSNNLVEGNRIGTDPTGSNAIGNYNGVEVFQADSNTINGNTIAGNTYCGIFVSGYADFNENGVLGIAESNTISNNGIGIDLSNGDLNENQVDGIYFFYNCNANTVSGNAILDSGGDGIGIQGSNSNNVTGNYIGTTANETTVSGQSDNGVNIYSGSSNNTINGNVIVRSGEVGIEIQGANTTGNLVENNLIGVGGSVDGSGIISGNPTTAAGGFNLRNSSYGVEISSGAYSNSIGGVGVGNIISNNGVSNSGAGGILITGSTTSSNVVQGNFIGTNPAGANLYNDDDGIDIGSGSNDTIGGAAPGEGNIIAFNGGYGIDVYDGNSSSVIKGNLVGAVPNPSLSSLNTTTIPSYKEFSGTDATFTTTSAPNGNIDIQTANNLGVSVSVENNVASVPSDPPGLSVGPNDITIHNRVIKAPAANVPIAIGGSTFLTLTTTNGTVVAKLTPFGTSWTGGMSVAYGDVFGNGAPDIIVGAGAGGGPQVVVYDSTTFQVMASFYAFDPKFTGGVNVAAADFIGNGHDDIIAAAGSGGGPQVIVFDSTKLLPGLSVGLPPAQSIMTSFYAFTPSFRGGVTVAADDVNGDGSWDLILGAGSGGGPQVLVVDGSKMTQAQANGEIASSAVIGSFYAFASSFSGGVNVAAGDTNHDNSADIFTSAGPGGGSQVTLWDGATFKMLDSFFAFGSGFSGGVSVGTADFNRDGHLTLLAAAQSGSNQVSLFDATTLSVLNSFAAVSQGNSIAGTRS